MASTRIDLRACPLAAASAPFGCDWCGKPLSGRQRRWCGPLCARAFENNHFWNSARAAAKSRDRHKCVRCGRHEGLEVNHIYPLVASIPNASNRYAPSCLHHLVGLETLCKKHHLEATAQQRADGLIGKRNRNR